jgi:cyclopropane-fatty-acyl-phospholipid synthase
MTDQLESGHNLTKSASAAETDRATAGRVDPDAWPDVVAVPARGVRSKMARVLFNRAVQCLPLRVILPDGETMGAGDLDSPVMRLVRPDHFARRLGAAGLIGFGEAYQAGDWTADDLTSVLTVFAEQMSTLIPPWLQRGRTLYVKHQPRREKGTRANTRNNIARHYDLSNDLFSSFLDGSMTYSSALFERDEFGHPNATWELLLQAQQRKIDRLLDLSGVGPGTRVLEIGTGWGELALRAAARGAQVHSITLSQEQADLARDRIEEAGFGAQVNIELCDYRDVRGTYDAVLSVEMIEAVGYDFWPIYFGTLDRVLRPGGFAGLQAITMPHERMLASRDTYTWIQKYIFPGGLIPSIRSVRESVHAHTSLRIVDDLAFGDDYAETLRVWRHRFENEARSGSDVGFDPTFGRMWSLYLAYSEAGFRSRYLDVHQFVLRKPTDDAINQYLEIEVS